MTEPLRVQLDRFEDGSVRCPACGRLLISDAHTRYLESATRPDPIGAALVCDACSSSVRLWFSPAG